MDGGKSIVANFAIASGPAATRFYVNSGGLFHTAQDGSPFASNIAGSTYSTTASISNTTDDVLYQSERFGSSFGYDIPLVSRKIQIVG
jgi:hypothetical protein